MVKTTVRLHGRDIQSSFTELISNNKKVKNKKCIDCLKNCSYRFCTLDSLKTSMSGDCENDLVIAGARVDEIKEILPVQTIINNIMSEYEASM